MNTNNDYYKTLGISEEEIKKAYRERARKYHLDNYNPLNPKKRSREKN